MVDSRLAFTVFSLERVRPNLEDPGYFQLKRKIPNEVICYRVPLKTPIKDDIDRMGTTPSLVGSEFDIPLFNDLFRDPLIRFTFIDGTLIELSHFNDADLEYPYQISKFKEGEQLISHRLMPDNMQASLAFIDYPTNSTWCVMRVLNGKGKR